MHSPSFPSPHPGADLHHLSPRLVSLAPVLYLFLPGSHRVIFPKEDNHFSPLLTAQTGPPMALCRTQPHGPAWLLVLPSDSPALPRLQTKPVLTVGFHAKHHFFYIKKLLLLELVDVICLLRKYYQYLIP